MKTSCRSESSNYKLGLLELCQAQAKWKKRQWQWRCIPLRNFLSSIVSIFTILICWEIVEEFHFSLSILCQSVNLSIYQSVSVPTNMSDRKQKWLGDGQKLRWLWDRQKLWWLWDRQKLRCLGNRKKLRWLWDRQKLRWLWDRQKLKCWNVKGTPESCHVQ